MDQPQPIPPIPNDTPPEEVSRPTEEVAQEAVREIESLIDAGDHSGAWEEFDRLHPADQGDVLDNLPRGAQQSLLAEMETESVAGLLEFLEPEESAGLLRDVDSPRLAEILDLSDADVATDFVRLLPEEQQMEVLDLMRESDEVAELLQYRDDSAGGLMSPEFPVVSEVTTIPNTLDQLRLLGPEAENIYAVLVVNDDRQLVGSLSITRLALARDNVLVGDIMDREFISVTTQTDQEETARVMQHYNLSQLPVIDSDGRLTGVIMAEDIVDVVEEEATEDMFRIASIAGERVLGPLGNSLRSRMPWLVINLGTAFLAAFMVSLFESTISKVVALAVFLPVVAGQGGIGGTQTVTLVVRSMALGEVPRRLGIRLLTREVALGLVHGIVLGVIVGVVAYAWKGNAALGLVLGMAMLGNMTIAGLAGAGVPLLLRRLRMDPAVSSAVFVTTFTDVIGFVLFLGLAAAFVRFLV